MDDYRKILIEESDIKPNKFVAKTMVIVFAVVFIAELLNEVNIFYVEKWMMRISFAFCFLSTGIIEYIVHDEKYVADKKSKYIILSLVIFTVFLNSVILDQWASFSVFLPLVLGNIYHNKAMSKLAIISGGIIAGHAPMFSYLCGFWQVDFYQYLINLMGFDVTLTSLQTNNIWLNSVYIFLYIGLPRMAMVLAFSTVQVANSKNLNYNIQHRINALFLSEHDILTKLYNRASYERRITELSKLKKIAMLSCVYADANGLHEINNEFGHDAGDRLIITCGSQLQQKFGDENVYRIGGDEFVVLIEGLQEENVKSKVAEITKILEEKGYYLSIGVKFEEKCTNVNELINDAEKEMFICKNNYYISSGKDRRKR